MAASSLWDGQTSHQSSRGQRQGHAGSGRPRSSLPRPAPAPAPVSPPQPPYLPGGTSLAWAWAWAWAGAGASWPTSLRCASSRATSAGRAGGEPSSSTLVTILPMVNQSLIWSRVSLRNMLTGRRPRLFNLGSEKREHVARRCSARTTQRPHDAASAGPRPRPAASPPIRAPHTRHAPHAPP